MWGHPGWGGGPEWMLDRIEGRPAFLKQELKITDAQAAAWEGFANALRAVTTNHAERMKTLFAGREASKALPERIEGQELFLATLLEGSSSSGPSSRHCMVYFPINRKPKPTTWSFP